MNILFVVHGMPPWARAGTENYTDILSAALAAGHEVAVFWRRNDPRLPEHHVTSQTRRGVQLFGVNNKYRRVGSYESSYSNEEIDLIFGRIARDFEAEIVHVEHLADLSVGIVDVAKEMGLPVVMTLNDWWLICPTGQFVRPDGTPCETDADCVNCLGAQLTATRATRRAHDLARRIAPPNGAVMKTLGLLNRMRGAVAQPGGLNPKAAVRRRRERMLEMTRKIDRFLAPSQYMKEQMSRIIDPAKIEVNRYGYNYRGCDLPHVPAGKIRFGFLGSIVPWKGLPTLLKAHGRLESEACDIHVHGGIVDLPARREWADDVRKLLAWSKARYTGAYDQADVYKLLAAIDVLVVASTSAENSPLVIHEARAARVPVIASRIGGIPELVEDGETGILVPPGDVEALSTAMRRFITDLTLVERMRKKITAPRAIEDDAARHVEVYREMLR